MSRYRQIHCLIWNDNKFPFLNDDTQLVFFHLMTTPLSTPFGLFKASIGALADEKRWQARRYRHAITDAIKHGMIEYDEKNYVIYIKNFLKYNLPNGPNQAKTWGSIYKELPPTHLKIPFQAMLYAMTDAMTDAMRDAIRDAFREASPIQEQEQEQEQDNPLPPKGRKGEAVKFQLPENILPEIWEAFCEMRRKIKKPLTEHAKKLVIDEVQKICVETFVKAEDVLNQSIRNDWQDVYPIKKNDGGNNGQRSNTHRADEKRTTLVEESYRQADRINAEYLRRKAEEA